jgi:hypothetical protein
MPDRLAKAKQLHAEALGRAPEERESFLDRECGPDTELRRQVAALLANEFDATRDHSPSPAPAARIGRYEVVQRLGAGGMGVVLLARDTVLQRMVAVKSLLPGEGNTEERAWMQERLLREARAAAMLSHPGIATLHDVIQDSGVTYVVMEFVQGTTLADILQRGRQPREWVIDVVIQTAGALDYAHAKGIIHRDIKPPNLLRDSAGRVKIVDFGIAKILHSETETTKGIVMGTVEYMSPEQINAQPLTGRADQFALAVMSYRMLTGRALFPNAESIGTLSYLNCHGTPEDPSEVDRSLPSAVDAVFRRALAKAADQRYPTCTEFALALRNALGEIPAPPVAALSSDTAAPPAAAASAPAVAPMLPVEQPLGAPSTVRETAADAGPAFHLTADPPNRILRAIGIAAAGVIIAGLAGLGVSVWKEEARRRDLLGKMSKDTPASNSQPEKKVESGAGRKGTITEKLPVPSDGRGGKQPLRTKGSVPAYSGPEAGQMVWTGTLAPGATLALEPGVPAFSGAYLPGVAVTVEITPSVVEIVTPPNNNNRWKRLVMRNAAARPLSLIIVKWRVSK